MKSLLARHPVVVAALIVPVLLIAFLGAWLGPSYRQHLALESIERSSPGCRAHGKGESVLPGWMRTVVGEEWASRFRRLKRVELRKSNRRVLVDLGPVGAFVDMEELAIGGCRVHPTQLRAVFGLQHLEFIGLSACTLEGDRVFHLENLPELRRCEFRHVDFHGVRFARLPKLELLSFGNTSLEEETLEELTALPSLKYLRVSDSRITDAGLPTLARIPNLRMLDLRIGGGQFDESKPSPFSIDALRGLRESATLEGVRLRDSCHKADWADLNDGLEQPLFLLEHQHYTEWTRLFYESPLRGPGGGFLEYNR